MQASSIGIIGGADGPTAIFIAGRLWPFVLMAVVLAAVLLLILRLLFKNR